MLDTPDLLRLLHPMLAVVVVLPLVGIATYFATQTRQRRLQLADKDKTKIPPVVGQEHVKIGRWLAGAVVGLALLGLAHPIFKNIIQNQVWAEQPFQVVFIGLMFGLTIAVLALLYRARSRVWRAIFAILTGMGLVILGSQDGVFRRTYEWYVSHYYFGMAAALLMIFSLAILPDIYRSLTWRRTHVVLNTVAVLLFISQGITGTRDLLEIPLHWQEPYIFQCDFANQTCPD
ncbi:hypothetical protein XM38_022430 [Halomicronema hongdechloris C2206]|uniref:DUF4079 domain-containing protein n=1 Tax=Halomicronema hongdechloris C2206 TaxID=1641165 RepID=A0A1Z3HLW2_9CYAN|nr:DUF4079 domain-containing protein [Halomicronema hongdechloris]ASC71291.1 hypothetical protein XM38_022430 [Halomicronema hongdechloris C2206]